MTISVAIKVSVEIRLQKEIAMKTEKRKSKPDLKQKLERIIEFFGGLDFLVTFLAMKKVTRNASSW